MTADSPQSYKHTQHSPLYLLLIAIAAGLLMFAWAVRDEPSASMICLAVALLMILAALTFRDLTVRDEGDSINIRYGPLRAFQKRVFYSDITSVEAGRSKLIDGWGIHWIPGRGWTFNLWGYDCAKLHVRGETIRIGSDDVPHLVGFLRGRIMANTEDQTTIDSSKVATFE